MPKQNATPRELRCQIIKSKKQWYWRIVAGNNKVLCHSEKYKRRRDCEHAAELMCAPGYAIPMYYVTE